MYRMKRHRRRRSARIMAITISKAGVEAKLSGNVPISFDARGAAGSPTRIKKAGFSHFKPA